MSVQQQVFTPIEAGDLYTLAVKKKQDGWRFVECHANRPYKDDSIEVIWTFADDAHQAIEMYETYVAPGSRLESISHLYPCAFMFENEMHDLYGLTIDNLLIDYKGGFYHIHFDAPMLAKKGQAPTPKEQPQPQQPQQPSQASE